MKIKENLTEVIPKENKVTSHYDSYEGCFYYICPNCGLEQEMKDLTIREESNLEKGNAIYYQCNSCETIAEVTYEDE